MRDNSMKRTQFHRNINKGCWTHKPQGKAVHYAQAVLADITVTHPSFGNKKFVACHNKTGPRKVFAHFMAATVQPETMTAIPANAERICFDPTKGDTHFHVIRNGNKVIVDHLSKAWATNDKTGTMMAIVHTTNGVMK